MFEEAPLDSKDEEAVLWLDKVYDETKWRDMAKTRLVEELDLSPDEVDAFVQRLATNGLCTTTTKTDGKIIVLPKIRNAAEYIRRQRQKAQDSDKVNQFVQRARRNPILAVVILVAKVMGVLFVLVLAILGILAFFTD